MPIRHAIWKVNQQPLRLEESALEREELLREMILADPKILSNEWMIIGKQEHTGHGGFIDLLAIAYDGSLVVIELKRDRTPREVVAQALDYAAWAWRLTLQDAVEIYNRLKPDRNFLDDFRTRFEQPINEDAFNQSHQIVVVASSLDERTERIINYLSERDIPINALFFQVHKCEESQLLSRAWLINPDVTEINAANSVNAQNEPWNGEFYINFGHGSERLWEHAIQYGFICMGGGARFSGPLKWLKQGDRIWVKAPGYGFVGVGKVIGPRERATEFKVQTSSGEMPVLDVVTLGNYHRQFANDPDNCEYFVPVRWLDYRRNVEDAFHEVGLFGVPNCVARPTSQKWRATVERLKSEFPRFDG